MLMHNDLVALSFVDYFRPKFLLIENARNLVSFDNMNPFQLIISSLLEMGYQVRFGVLQEAVFYGVAQFGTSDFILVLNITKQDPLQYLGVEAILATLLCTFFFIYDNADNCNSMFGATIGIRSQFNEVWS
ncbi:unnamed protein product [Cuscuta campestris]|uniref:DNA (cytosine-5-)-methyltransferase n=1 Tax=Cuscuta campestris TaxID=132261 RepID=A0A484KT13_9ASTE|nr:unnamed protein product [Cuscuta campestris]